CCRASCPARMTRQRAVDSTPAVRRCRNAAAWKNRLCGRMPPATRWPAISRSMAVDAVRPSRRALQALLRTRQIFDGTKEIPHPEEAAKRPSRRTRDVNPALPGFPHNLESGASRPSDGSSRIRVHLRSSAAPRIMKWLRRSLYVVSGLVLLAAVVGVGGYLWLRSSLPETSGSIAVPRLGAKVEILRDGDGIVTIRAQSEADAYYALGFVHAQDRLFQMDMMRRWGAGRLSEVVGAAAADTDKFMRILGFYRLAEASLAKLPNEMRVTMEAYAAGVNAFLATRGGALPPEFALLGYSPEPWRPADSLVWGRLMA